MDHLTMALVRCYLAATAAITAPRERDERGDVPGWVMVTVMTAGIVAALWALAGDQLGTMLKNALSGVKAP